MPVRVPSNQIVTSKYTIGKEFIVESTYKDYQGYYYEFNDSYYAGEKFSTTAPKLIKSTSNKVNKLLLNPKTEEYAKASNYQLQLAVPPPSQANTFENVPDGLEDYNAYFYKKMVGKDILIKQIDEQSYNQYQNNPFYQVIKVKLNNSDTGIGFEELERADNEMSGFANWFLSGTSR